MKKFGILVDSLMGTAHTENQDAVLTIDSADYSLYFLFDGVSHAKNPTEGIGIVKKYVEENHSKYYQDKHFKLPLLMFDVNQYILNSGIAEPFTTYAVIFISSDGQQIKSSNLGDTRIYGVSEQYLFQYSRDDVDSKQRNIITKCLGMPELKNSDFSENVISPDEKKLLLCTDGFYNLMENQKTRFHKILNFRKIGNIKNGLSREISEKNEDDATYILINKTI